MADTGDIEQASRAVGMDQFTEESTETLRQRLKGSTSNICIGLLLFFGAFPLLFWNEGRAVERYDTLQEGQENTVTISATDAIDESNNYKLIHFTTNIFADSNTTLLDPLFGIETNDLKIKRDGEMYQWKETQSSKTVKKTGGGTKTETTYSYSKVWSSIYYDSSSFKKQSGHENPSGGLKYQDWSDEQDMIYAGSFVLPPEIVNRINWYDTYNNIQNTSIIPDEILRNKSTALSGGNGFFVKSSGSTTSSSQNSPEIGDSRVIFTTVKPKTVSIIAMQIGDTLQAFEAKAGGTVLLFEQGNFTADEMYQKAEEQNAAVAWLLRFVGFLIMSLGIYLVLSPIEVLADILPIIGNIVGCGLKFIALTVAGVLSGITISIAWLIHHPVIGIIVLVCITVFVVGVGWCVKMAQGNTSHNNHQAPDEPTKLYPSQPEKENEEEEKPMETDAEEEEEIEIKIDEPYTGPYVYGK